MFELCKKYNVLFCKPNDLTYKLKPQNKFITCFVVEKSGSRFSIVEYSVLHDGHTLRSGKLKIKII